MTVLENIRSFWPYLLTSFLGTALSMYGIAMFDVGKQINLELYRIRAERNSTTGGTSWITPPQPQPSWTTREMPLDYFIPLAFLLSACFLRYGTGYLQRKHYLPAWHDPTTKYFILVKIALAFIASSLFFATVIKANIIVYDDFVAQLRAKSRKEQLNKAFERRPFFGYFLKQLGLGQGLSWVEMLEKELTKDKDKWPMEINQVMLVWGWIATLVWLWNILTNPGIPPRIGN